MVFQTKIAVIVLLVACVAMLSCNSKTDIATVSLDSSLLPSVHGEDITSLFSDSGVTRFRIKTKQWDIFSNPSNPYWHFPKGIYVEQFDTLFNVKAFIQADTAYFFEKPELWQARNNVLIQNLEGMRFETSELFWKQNAPAEAGNAIYTDSLVRITTADGVISIAKKGMRANQTMTEYSFYDHSYETDIAEGPLVSSE